MTRLSNDRVIFGMSVDNASRLTAFGQPQTVLLERIFGGSVTEDEKPRIGAAIKAARVPYFSVKPGSWSAAAKGAIDSRVRSETAAIAKLALAGNSDVIWTWHHEPTSTPSNPTGEGGTAADWQAMWLRLMKLQREEWAKVVPAGGPKLWLVPTGNGWWFRPRGQGGTQGLTEANKQLWMPKVLRDAWDGIGADYYRKDDRSNDPAATMRLAEAWFKANGVTAAFVGEFAAPSGDEAFLTAVGDQVLKPGSMWRAVAYWNSDRTDQKFGVIPGSAREKVLRALFTRALAYRTGGTSPPPPPPPPDPVDDPRDVAKIAAAQTALSGSGTALERIAKAKAALG